MGVGDAHFLPKESSMVRMRALVLTAIILAATVAALAAGPQQGSAPAKGTLDVLVLDTEGNRLRGATVAVPGYRSTTGLAGSCRFSLVPGRYSVLISKDGYRGRRINAGVKPGETTTLRVELQRLSGRAAPKEAPAR